MTPNEAGNKRNVMAKRRVACAQFNDNDNRDPSYVVALDPHQHPGKVDPHRWHCKQSHNAAARVEKIKAMTIADANANAEEHCTACNRHKGKKRKPGKFQAAPMEQMKEVAKWNDQKGP
jgi:hypothetical protein